MTIETDHRTNQQVEAVIALCRTCRDRNGITLAQIHNGYGEDAEPIALSDYEIVEGMAIKHDRETGGEHNIAVIIFQR